MVLHILEAPVAQTCCQHWNIQPADGPVSSGVCQICSETREFKNSMDDWSFFKETVRVRNEFGVEILEAEE